MAKDDFYITLLKILRDKTVLGESVSYDDVKVHIESTHPEISEETLKRIFFGNNIVQELADFGEGIDLRIRNNTPHIITLDAYFHLLEHQELREARQSSKWAQWTATFAILISIAVGSWQIFNSATVNLDESQLERLIASSKNAPESPTAVILDSSQFKQLLTPDKGPTVVVIDKNQFDLLIEAYEKSQQSRD